MSKKRKREAARNASEPYQKNMDINVRTEDAQTLEDFRSVIVHRVDELNIPSYGTNVKNFDSKNWVNRQNQYGGTG